MAFSRVYELVNFDPSTATLLINLFTYELGNTEDQITADIEVPVVLPVDSNGKVPVGTALTQFLNRHVISITPDSFLQSMLELKRFNGQVVNANEVYNETSDVEPTEADQITAPLTALWIPVLIIPDRTYTNSGTTFTRSIVAAVGGNNGAPIMGEQFVGDPQPKIGLPQYQLLNTYINGSVLKLVHHARSDGFPQEADITSNINLFTAPEYITALWPYVYNQDGLSSVLAGGGVLSDYQHYYYLEHDPLDIPVSYARGWIQYGI